MMLIGWLDDYKIGQLEVRCSGRILCEVNLPKAIEFAWQPTS